MFNDLDTTKYNTKPIVLSYLNHDRKFFKEVTTLSSNDPFIIQQTELSSVLDFSISFDSVNILTEGRGLFSTNRTQSSLSVYTNITPELDCESVTTSINNYWVTLPLDGYIDTVSGCNGCVNITPLKNNFNQQHQTLCNSPYREYRTFNFGELGFDNLKPQLLFTTNSQTESIDKIHTNFIFRIPDLSEPISGDALSSFNCWGSVVGDCPNNADNIIWSDGERIITSWFKGDDPCSGGWVERYIDVNGELSDTLPNSELVLLSGIDYEYVRPYETMLTNTNFDAEEIENSIFILGETKGTSIYDRSPNNIVPKIIN